MLYAGPLWKSYVQGSYYSYNSCLATDIFKDLPLSAKGNLCGLKYLLPALSILQLFYRDEPRSGNYLQLAEDGKLITSYTNKHPLGKLERHLIGLCRRIGFLSHSKLVQYPAPGNGIHYAGTLPVSGRSDMTYHTDFHGRLSRTRRVYVADASVFPVLPAKNHTFTIMANAMRVVDCMIKDTGAA
jgi:choline dehydrogenase-like flavoprotein